MSQKPIVMEQLKQILQLKYDGIGIQGDSTAHWYTDTGNIA